MSIWSTLWSCLCTVEGLIFAILLIFAVYKYFTTPRKFYPFHGLKSEEFDKTLKKPQNKSSKPEKRCKQIFESIFNYKFHKVRPKWLINPKTMRELEIDGFCEYIKTPLGTGLGFEYNGKQHSKYTPYFHKSEQDFIDQVQRDRIKERLCSQRGILLISIPYVVPFEELEQYIRNKLKQKGVLI